MWPVWPSGAIHLLKDRIVTILELSGRPGWLASEWPRSARWALPALGQLACITMPGLFGTGSKNRAQILVHCKTRPLRAELSLQHMLLDGKLTWCGLQGRKLGSEASLLSLWPLYP